MYYVYMNFVGLRLFQIDSIYFNKTLTKYVCWWRVFHIYLHHQTKQTNLYYYDSFGTIKQD